MLLKTNGGVCDICSYTKTVQTQIQQAISDWSCHTVNVIQLSYKCYYLAEPWQPLAQMSGRPFLFPQRWQPSLWTYTLLLPPDQSPIQRQQIITSMKHFIVHCGPNPNLSYMSTTWSLMNLSISIHDSNYIFEFDAHILQDSIFKLCRDDVNHHVCRSTCCSCLFTCR